MMSTARSHFEATVSVGGRAREGKRRWGGETRDMLRKKKSWIEKSIPSLCGTQRGKFSFCVSFVCNRPDLIEIEFFFLARGHLWISIRAVLWQQIENSVFSQRTWNGQTRRQTKFHQFLAKAHREGLCTSCVLQCCGPRRRTGRYFRRG